MFKNFQNKAIIKNLTENGPIYCPCCASKLEVTHQDNYRAILESCFEGKPTLKDGYQCMNEDCIAHRCKLTWIYEGGIYYSNEAGIPNPYLRQNLEKYHTIFSCDCAIGSYEFWIELGKKACNKLSFSVPIGKYKIKFKPNEFGWNYSFKKRHQPNLLSWNITFWKSDNNSTIMVIPFWKMIIWKIKSFIKDYQTIKANPKESNNYLQLNNCNYILNENTSLVEKLTSFILKTFYRKKVNFIK